MPSYQEHALDGASPVDLVVALYDGILRFLYAAVAAVERGDVQGRRAAVKRSLDILIHLQARLRMDIGGRPALVLSEFYASMFALILQASQAASAQRFEHVIGCVKTVRDAWRQIASDPAVSPSASEAAASAAANPSRNQPARDQPTRDEPNKRDQTLASRSSSFGRNPLPADPGHVARWTA
jgi:flagellar protein FliS